MSRHNLAVAYHAAGRTEDAIKLLEATISQEQSKLGNDHVETLISRIALAAVYHAAGRIDDAIKLYEADPPGIWQRLGPDHPTPSMAAATSPTLITPQDGTRGPSRYCAMPWNGLASSSARPIRAPPSMASLGLNLIRQQKWGEAESILRECLAIREKAQPDDWSTFNTRSLLGGSLIGQKKFAEAEPLILAGYEGMKAREAKIPAAG